MNAEIISNKMLNNKFGYMELRCKEIASEQNAGRFFMISATPDGLTKDPLLKRPFAICDITSPDTFTFLYMIVGRGTELLAQAKAGAVLSVTGPLGNYFRLEKNAHVALLAGGVGIGPMVITAKRLREAGSKVTLFYGGKTASDIILQDMLPSVCDELVIVTDDGTLGVKGLVIDPLKKRIDEFKKVYACGPNRMLKAAADMCGCAMVNIEVSLDEQMGCGVGACLGCMIDIREQHGNIIQKRCCVEGPVFNGVKVDWASLIRC